MQKTKQKMLAEQKFSLAWKYISFEQYFFLKCLDKLFYLDETIFTQTDNRTYDGKLDIYTECRWRIESSERICTVFWVLRADVVWGVTSWDGLGISSLKSEVDWVGLQKYGSLKGVHCKTIQFNVITHLFGNNFMDVLFYSSFQHRYMMAQMLARRAEDREVPGSSPARD